MAATTRPAPPNPYKPSAGHRPPVLAGRDGSIAEFLKYLDQTSVATNIILTGLRGVGKTVLLEELKPLAIAKGWVWVGTDLSEAASMSDESLATRLLADLSVVSSYLKRKSVPERGIGFTPSPGAATPTLDYDALVDIFARTPGLVSDKIKAVLQEVWDSFKDTGKTGIIFAYDEAQNLSDHAEKDEFPMSLLLEIFQSIQRKGMMCMLVLTGLPTLFPKLVEARTFAERMFHVITLDKLSEDDSRKAVIDPIKVGHPFQFSPGSVAVIVTNSGGYPFFIQFICREAYDLILQNWGKMPVPMAPIEAILRKLDTDFFSPRWNLMTDREQDIVRTISVLPTCTGEFSIQEITEKSKSEARPFTSSHANQLLLSLCNRGIIYKMRFGKYCFAVPLFWQFVTRQARPAPGAV